MRKETANLGEFYFTEQLDCFTIYYSPQCESTQALLKKLLPLYSQTGPILLYTFHQTRGRGQGNHTWESEAGKNLAFTLAWDITDSIPALIAYNKAIAIGMQQALSIHSHDHIRIKWPNDIMAGNCKICGMLMETHKEGTRTYLLAGIGINVNQTVWKGNFEATSLKLNNGQEIEIIQVLKSCASQICKELNLITSSFGEDVHSRFNDLLWQKNQWVMLENDQQQNFEAYLLGVDEMGRLFFKDKNQHTNNMHHGQVRIAKNN